MRITVCSVSALVTGFFTGLPPPSHHPHKNRKNSKKIMSRLDSENVATTDAPPVGGVHGSKGFWIGGVWRDMEECDEALAACRKTAKTLKGACPRSQTRHSAVGADGVYDVVIIGAGCVGASVARELSKTTASVLMIDSADDVSQGATKGNSGIVHAGYDDKPGSIRAAHCWKGNQMFPRLDRELRFGYDKNGSLVVAKGAEEEKVLQELMSRGETNGVRNLRIIDREELFKMEPGLHPDVTAALYSPDAGSVVPYEFAIALAENAADNGVEIRLRRELTSIKKEKEHLSLSLSHWEPKTYTLVHKWRWGVHVVLMLLSLAFAVGGVEPVWVGYCFVALSLLLEVFVRRTPATHLGTTPGRNVADWMSAIALGGSGSATAVHGEIVAKETVKARYIVNCAGSGAGDVARMLNDTSFTITPRLGEYLLQHKSEGEKVRCTIFPAPHPIKGKGVLVQATLWGNLILGPTARDISDKETARESTEDINKYIMTKCKELVPSLDASKTIHAFCGARAKSDRKDWIIEVSAEERRMIHAAGIDSPGLAGSPSIALKVIELLTEQGLTLLPNESFIPNRAPIVRPKEGWKGLKASKRGTPEHPDPSQNVICKCELVTKAEVLDALSRSLPIDSTQAIRKRTRAGMGHCQGDPCNYDCEARVAEVIAQKTGLAQVAVGRRPWPATSTLPQRWMTESQKLALKDL